jgi:hypothetical protein
MNDVFAFLIMHKIIAAASTASPHADGVQKFADSLAPVLLEPQGDAQPGVV